MANPKEDKIDFSKLERELFAAVDADAAYWRENDAKLRAMDQRVETYDQFRDMVAAAHIKPLDKKDKIGQGSRHQPWNPFSSTSSSSSALQATDPSQSSNAGTKVIPKNGHEFTKEWRKRKKSPGDCCSYLLDIGGTSLAQIFKSEISFGLLGEIVASLNEHAVERDCGKVADILLCLTRAGRFSLSLDFLSGREKRSLTELVVKLEQWTANVKTADSSAEEGAKRVTEEQKTDREEKGEETLGGMEGEDQTVRANGDEDCGLSEVLSGADIVNLRKLYKLEK